MSGGIRGLASDAFRALSDRLRSGPGSGGGGSFSSVLGQIEKGVSDFGSGFKDGYRRGQQQRYASPYAGGYQMPTHPFARFGQNQFGHGGFGQGRFGQSFGGMPSGWGQRHPAFNQYPTGFGNFPHGHPGFGPQGPGVPPGTGWQSGHGQAPKPDHYGALGIEKDASAGDIRKAYLKRARQEHPDYTRSAIPDDVSAEDWMPGKPKFEAERSRRTEAFKPVADAYAVLSDANTRDEFDKKPG